MVYESTVAYVVICTMTDFHFRRPGVVLQVSFDDEYEFGLRSHPIDVILDKGTSLSEKVKFQKNYKED